MLYTGTAALRPTRMTTRVALPRALARAKAGAAGACSVARKSTGARAATPPRGWAASGSVGERMSV
eukprot:644112-Lingulodinium_polyedra.AAC.1